MAYPDTLVTPRLLLRQWQPDDLEPYAQMNADPKVMQYMPTLLDRQQSDAQAQKRQHHIDQYGWGFWAVETQDTQTFIGYVGLQKQTQYLSIPHTPFVEIGWRISAAYWGQGFAPEAAAMALQFAFNTLHLSAVYAFTSLVNIPSQRVMQKIGMHDTHTPFSHPKLPATHPLAPHCLYKIDDLQWRTRLETTPP